MPRGDDSVTQRITETLERIADRNPSLNAFITVLEAAAMAQAHVLDAELRQGRSRGPLHGLPISIKDLIDVAGVATTAASRLRLGHIAQADATVVSRLRDAGAVIIGKCNLHEFALGITNEESAFGPARHPRDPNRSPGGSSGGSAAAVAAALGWASIGTDTGGSIRIPAAACGVVGLKPTFGEIPTHGVVPLSVSLDHVGPLAASVRDAWMLFGVLNNSGSLPASTAPASVTELRLGRLGGYFEELLDAGVRRMFSNAVDRLRDAGASVHDVRIPDAPRIAETYVNVALPEAFAFHATNLETHREEYSDGVRQRLEMGRHVSSETYADAQRMRGKFRESIDAVLARCDVLVLPTLPVPAPMIGADTVDIDGVAKMVRPMMLRLTQLFNLTGHPAISLPCGNTPDGLPCGLQLVGRRQATVDLLAVALSCEPYVTQPAL